MITAHNTISNITTLHKERLRRAQAVLRKLKKILVEKYDVKKIVLIGSFASQERFGFHSDIDLCVEGLSDNLFFEAVGELLIESEDFNVDIIPIEDASPEMKEKIKSGKLIYEKGRNLTKKVKGRNYIRA